MSDENQLLEPGQVSPTDEAIPNESIRVSHTAQTVHGWPPGQQNFRRRETFPASLAILLIVLALVLIGGGFAFILYVTTAQYRASLQAEATTAARLAAQTRVAVQLQNQATANAFATANSHIYATATAQSSATATLTAQADNATT